MVTVLKHKRTYWLRLLTGVLLFIFAVPGAAQVKKLPPPSEYLVKAAILTKFLKFVEWPADMANTDTLVIRVIGKEPSDDYFKNFLDNRYNGRRLEIRRHRKYKEGLVVNDCQVLFISRPEKRHTQHLLEAVRGMNVLTVGETRGFVDQGGMVNFVNQGSKVRFEVNQHISNESGIRINSYLLRRAVYVVRKKTGK